MTTISRRKASAPVMGVGRQSPWCISWSQASLVVLSALAGPYFWQATPAVVPIPGWKRGSPEAMRDFLGTVCRTGCRAEVEMRQVADHAVGKRLVQRRHKLVQGADQKS